MSKSKPLAPKNIKFTDAQIKFIKKTAEAQGHDNFSAVVKRLIDREMNIKAGA